jgi:hypothetical protein
MQCSKKARKQEDRETNSLPSMTTKRIPCTKASRGHKYVLQRKSSVPKSTAAIDLRRPDTALKVEEILEIYSNCSSCCVDQCIISFCNCNGNHNLNLFTDIILLNRSKVRIMTNDEKRNFVMSKFKEAVDISNKSQKLSFQFRLSIPAEYESENEVRHLPVCRTAWGLVHGISKYSLDMCSSVIKENPDAQGCHLKHRKFADSTLHPYSHNEAMNIFYKNAVDFGKFLFCAYFPLSQNYTCADPQWASYSITPSADIQHTAALWISDYYDDYGDVAPNKLECRLAIPSKKELYAVYKKQHEDHNLPFVLIEKFRELWNALLPYKKIRTWISPTGKCGLCGDIDAMRQKASETHVQEALRQCHLMHRGGFIFPERAR